MNFISQEEQVEDEPECNGAWSLERGVDSHLNLQTVAILKLTSMPGGSRH